MGRRRYSPELAASGLLEIQDWVRDDLPDLLWPALLLADEGNNAVRRFVRWQDSVQADLAGDVDPKVLAECLDGRLTGLDRLTERHPEARAHVLDRAAEFDLLPEAVAQVLRSYPERPASWLVDGELQPPTDGDIDLLASAVREVVVDGHREALLKCLHIWSSVQAGTFSSDVETIELLKPYPDEPETRNKADTVVRASWAALRGVQLHHDPARFDQSINWAKVFWGTNSLTTKCLRRRDVEDQSNGGDDDQVGAPEQVEDEANRPGETAEQGAHLQRLAMDLVSSYVEALETAPARLYDQERQEVHGGLVTRAGREVVAALGSPALWGAEHGSYVNRMLVEVRIYLHWMTTQEASIYRRYQDYGAGKAKLYARIMGELRDELQNEQIGDAIAEFDRLSHTDDVIDHRVVDTSDSFSGKSIRAMAEECGLLDLYRHVYYVASGVAHSEWWSIEAYAMERCLNILHRGHLIPRLSMPDARRTELAEAWVDHLHTLIRLSLQILGTDSDVVDHAFDWLEPETGGLKEH